LVPKVLPSIIACFVREKVEKNLQGTTEVQYEEMNVQVVEKNGSALKNLPGWRNLAPAVYD
jgi:hypothetical protein